MTNVNHGFADEEESQILRSEGSDSFESKLNQRSTGADSGSVDSGAEVNFQSAGSNGNPDEEFLFKIMEA